MCGQVVCAYIGQALLRAPEAVRGETTCVVGGQVSDERFRPFSADIAGLSQASRGIQNNTSRARSLAENVAQFFATIGRVAHRQRQAKWRAARDANKLQANGPSGDRQILLIGSASWQRPAVPKASAESEPTARLLAASCSVRLTSLH